MSKVLSLEFVEYQNFLSSEDDLEWLRTNIGVVFQQPILFSESIRFNLTLGFKNQNTSDEDIWEALKLAEAKEFIKELPQQLEEYVGSSGGNLSGGQKQRVAIARTILRNPSIYLFDEATSALDNKNEHEIQTTLDRISVNKTSISVAHRLSTIQNSDLILVFDKGQLVDKGNHTELKANSGGIYSYLLSYSHDETDTASLEMTITDIKRPKKKSSFSRRESLDPQLMPVLVRRATILAVNNSELNPHRISLFSFLKEEKKLIPWAILFSIIGGAHHPIFGYLNGKVINYLILFNCFFSASNANVCEGTYDDIKKKLDIFIYARFGYAFFAFVSVAYQLYLFSLIGESFTLNLRTAYFRKLIYNDTKYFGKK